MADILDKARDLAEAFKQSAEFARYEAAKLAAMENETTKALINEYQQLGVKLQMQLAAGAQADKNQMERMQRVMALMQMSPEAMAYLMAEINMRKTLADIFKILSDAAGIDLDVLGGAQ